MSRASADEPAVDATAMQAAEWIVRLTADDPAERERARRGFEAWKRADPEHAATAAGMERLLGQLLQADIHVLEPKAESLEQIAHVGEEMGYVIEGEFELRLGD
uniref:DUF4880 domain-containing protein n=1 Tax=Variovorax paradoxus TaxID=34073 RepID=UPI0038D1A2C6